MKRLASLLIALAAAFFLAGSGAQSTSIPSVDLSVGPLGTSSQAVNVALALSVEFPTAGAAYRSTTTYSTGTVYIGYWDSNGCYQYFDTADTSSLGGNYFYRTGNTDSSGYCNTSGAGTGYSGNMLNWAATSAIDNLRLTLTGGNRVVDTSSKTVLGRAYLPNAFSDGGYNSNTGDTYWPLKLVPASLVGKVTPAYTTPGGTSAYNGTVYIRSCQDKIFVGTASSGGNCASPGNANNLAPYVPSSTSSVTTRGFVTTPVNSTTTTYVITSPTQAYWGRDPSNSTTTTMPSGNDPVAGALVPEEVLPSPRNTTITGTASTPQYAGDSVTTVTWSLTGNTVTVAPSTQTLYGTTTTAPTTVVGTTWTAVSGGEWIAEEIPDDAPTTQISTNQKRNVCYSGSTRVRLQANGACTSPLKSKSTSGLTLYRKYNQVTRYSEYEATPVYTYYQTYQAWYVPAVYTVYSIFTNGSAPATMRAAVRVCDTSQEYASRTVGSGGQLCQYFPSGNYKPVGQLQKNAMSVRASAFGYVMDQTQDRYGGVLRAPMKFVGPQYRDTAGATQTNTPSEWDATTGVFAGNPLNDSSYSRSGVINYLNSFGSDGVYKTYDPVGELWYEALRYYQGLGPTSSATSSLSSGMYGGYPVYTSWTDPIQNACQRSNYILTIGDVNTHYDKQLPGLSALADTKDTARSAVSIPGGGSFDATTWTSYIAGFETNTDLTYTDPIGRTQHTLGNPSPLAANANLQSKKTGAGSSSAYYWAGAAYWANTQPIRKDTKTDSVTGRTSSMSGVRVKTFTIDVDEGGNGLIDGNTRGIPPRQSSFYLAGKYGWFKDQNQTGNPFGVSASGTRLWEDPTSPNTPDGYVLASQAQRLVAGIQKFFNAAVSGGGSLSVSALSSQRYSASSQSGDLFSTSFDPVTWSGTLYKRTAVFNTSTFTLQLLSGYAWDAGAILTTATSGTSTMADPYVTPANRNIWTWGSTGPVAFTANNLGQMSAEMQAGLDKNPVTNASDGRAAARVNYLRGDRSNEVSLFRARASVMGDVINSGPVYKGPADPTTTGAGYATFAESVADREPMVYVGANDGMLHAFRASDGKEAFAYVPKALAGTLNKLTNPAYTHQPYVDGVPAVGEVQVNGSWRTVLAGGMGGGARGIYALDVTHPTSFGASAGTSTSGPLWEFTNADDAMMGNVLSEPKLVKINVNGSSSSTPSYKWFVAVGSGYNNYIDDGSGRYTSTGNQALFLLALDRDPGDAWVEGTNYFKIPVPIATTGTANGLSSPGVLLGDFGEALALYAGDLQGQVWRFDLSQGLTQTKTTDGTIVKRSGGGVPLPIFTAIDSSNKRQPITVAPLVTVASGSGYMVVIGTGKFMEPSDNTTGDVQAIYSVWDAGTNTAADLSITRTDLFQMTATVGSSTVSLSTGTFALGRSSGQYMGCYFNLPDTGERIGVQGDQGNTSVAFNSLIPSSSCSADGNSRSYQFYPSSCVLASPVAAQSNSGYLSKPNFVDIDYGNVSGGNYHSRMASGIRKYDVRDIPVSATTGGGLVSGGGAGSGSIQQIKAGRLSWREIKSFN